MSRILFAAVGLCVCLVWGCRTRDLLPKDHQRQSFIRLLKFYDQHYDPSAHLIAVPFRGPGYHSKITPGTSVHPTRESLYYAVGSLQRGRDQDVSRAKKILAAVLELQQTEPNREAVGVWPWLLEEPLSEMDSVDLNWADFCGSAIAQVLVQHRDQINDPELIKHMKGSLALAADAIRTRDVTAGYTNIAVIGGGVCAVAGEVLEDSGLLEYGRRRLQDVAELTDRIDGFVEYNSPTYGKVVIGECERILHLAKDIQVRQAAERIRTAAWQMVSDSFHPTTNQWSGPHSRFSQRRLTDTLVMFLNDRTGLGIKPHPKAMQERPRGYGIVRPIPCPTKMLERMRQPPRTDRFLKRNFRIGDDGRPSIVGTTWQTTDACLGSVNRSSLWTQRNPVCGYWQTAQDPAVAFRIRFLRDGSDFASMAVRTVQQDNQVLLVVHSLQNRGDWHRTLDRPADGKFTASDFRLRIELEGAGVAAITHPKANQFSLRAGKRELAIFPADSYFQGHQVKWQCTSKTASRTAFVDALCYSGPAKEFDFSEIIDMELSAGFILQPTPSNETKSIPSPSMTEGSNRLDVQWRNLKVAAPKQADLARETARLRARFVIKDSADADD